MKRKMFLSIIMPAYNEGTYIYKNLLIVADLASKIVEKYEIICVDDGSIDNTSEQAKLATTQNENIIISSISPNQGKGNALRIGTSIAKGDHIMFLDSDLDLSPSSIGNFLEIMEKKEVEVVIGSKLHPYSKINYPAIRRFLSYSYYLLIRLLFNLNVRDTQTGMKLFKSSVIKPIMKKTLINRFAFDIEILSIINREGHHIVDAPIILEYGRSVSWGRIGFNTVMNIFLDTISIFYHLKIIRFYDH